MGKRIDLHNTFIAILGTQDEKKSRVYYDPPTSVEMDYPAIKYSLSGRDQKYANNATYTSAKRYEVTVMDFDEDSPIADEILKLPLCKFDRAYTVSGLHHTVFTLYH